jgi:energy-coupling factor transporter ATP-binding protein EcfA2
MNISRISAINFKGSTFDHHPGSITIFHGPNGAGKSSVIESLRLGMLGYDPRIPKKKPEMFRAFASGSPMKVEVCFDSGKMNSIELIDKKGTITGEIAINEEFPDHLLDLSDYWKASKADRAQLLMSMCVTAENSEKLGHLEGNIRAFEESISSDMTRRKTLEQGIAAKVSVDMEIKIQEPPKDLAIQIETNKTQLNEAQLHLRNFSGERAGRVAQENALASLKQAQAKAIQDAPEPVCEHCGNQVQFLKQIANTNFNGPVAEAYTKLQCMRAVGDIDASIKEWTDHVASLRSNIAHMEHQQQAWIKHCGSRSEEDKMQAELDVIGPRLEKSRESLKAAMEARRHSLAQYVAPLLQVANSFLKPTLDMELVIEEGEIGFNAGRFIPFVSLSGAQEVMAIAGLQLALSVGTKCRVVVMDELGKLHETTKIKLMETIQKLLNEGVIDQFMGADVSSKGYGKLPKKCFVEVVR